MSHVRIAIAVSEEMDQMIIAIRENRGYMNKSEVIRSAISEMYKREFKDYVQALKGRSSKSPTAKSPEERERERIQEEETRKKVQKEEKEGRAQQICDALDGRVVENSSGSKSCVYNLYEKVNPKEVVEGQQTVPFDRLTEDLIDRQYKPSREEVEEVWAKKSKSKSK